MGVLSAGTPASAAAFYPVNAWLIVTLGWQTALMAFGSIVAAATVSLALLYRDPLTDEECSREPDAAATEATQSTPAAGEEWTLRRALHSIRL